MYNDLNNPVRRHPLFRRMIRLLLPLAVTMVALGCADAAPMDDAELAPPSSDVSTDANDDAPGDRIEKGGFSSTCPVVTQLGQGPMGDPNILRGTCYNAAGRPLFSDLWLPACLGNSDGRLVRGTYYDRSCGNCQASGTWGDLWWNCDCRRRDGSWRHTSIRLDDFISNQNGVLACD